MFSAALFASLFAASIVDATLSPDYAPTAIPLTFLETADSVIEKRQTTQDKFSLSLAVSTAMTETQIKREYRTIRIAFGPEPGQILKAFEELRNKCSTSSCIDEFTFPGEVKKETNVGVRGVTGVTEHKVGPDYILEEVGNFSNEQQKNMLFDSLKVAVEKFDVNPKTFDKTDCRTEEKNVGARGSARIEFTRICDFKVPQSYLITLFDGENDIQSTLSITITNLPVSEVKLDCQLIVDSAVFILTLIDPILAGLGSVVGFIVCQ